MMFVNTVRKDMATLLIQRWHNFITACLPMSLLCVPFFFLFISLLLLFGLGESCNFLG